MFLTRSTLFPPLALSAAALALLPLPVRATEMPPAALGDIAAHVPGWVWVALLALIYLGLKRTQPRQVGLGGLVLMPGLLALYALSNVPLLGSGIETLAATVLGLMFGVGIGLVQERRHPPRALGDGRVLLEGEWSTLVVGLSVFAMRFAAGVLQATHPDLWNHGEIRMGFFALSVLFVSLLITRTFNRVRVAIGAPVTA